jgi:nucleotide-binding universal stress UspA family protein
MTAIRTLLVPLDGSELAEKALQVGIELAHAVPAQLVLVRATFQLDSAALSGADSAVLATAQEETDLHQGRQAMDELRSRLAQQGVVAQTVTSRGSPAAVIVDVATRHQADLIVMTTHGHAGMERMLFGSVAAEVLRRAPIPLFVVPPTIGPDWSANHPHRFLVLVDGSPLSERVLEPAGLVARTLEAEMVLLTVLEPPPVSTYAHMPHLAAQLREQERRRGQGYLDSLGGRLTADVASVRRLVLLARDTSQAIRNVATAERCDVIALASHGRGGLSRLLLGSTAADLVREATTPMLIVGPGCRAA